jgi:hypothetical protein
VLDTEDDGGLLTMRDSTEGGNHRRKGVLVDGEVFLGKDEIMPC